MNLKSYLLYRMAQLFNSVTVTTSKTSTSTKDESSMTSQSMKPDSGPKPCSESSKEAIEAASQGLQLEQFLLETLAGLDIVGLKEYS